MQIKSLEINQVGQFFGYAGVVANLIWPTMKSREKLLIGQVVACILMLTHFALLKANTGALVMTTAGIQAALAIPLGKHPSFKKVYLASLIATPLVCYATWKGYSSIFSSAALAIVSLGNFQTNTVRQRTFLIFAIFAWFAHNILIHSIPALVSNGIALLVSVYMLHQAHQKPTSTTSNAAA